MSEFAKNDPRNRLLLPPEKRQELFGEVWKHIEAYVSNLSQQPVKANSDRKTIQASVQRFDFEKPLVPEEAIKFVVDGFRQYQLHTGHPRYFGLFDPAVTTMGIIGDCLAAGFNSQLAVWMTNPIGVAIEQHLVEAFGEKLGIPKARGSFTSGGMEANLTAVLCALRHKFPDISTDGLTDKPRPIIYVSTEAHHSFHKSAMIVGIGKNSVREIPVTETLVMDTEALSAQIEKDRTAGEIPFLVVGTAGTTKAGAIEPLAEIAEIARNEKLWFHVDAAWGGAAALIPEFKSWFQGIELADSITIDPHKWLSVPVGAGLFLTRHSQILLETFAVSTNYLPQSHADPEYGDPYAHSIQWSRRFIGLKVFLSLAVAGWEGYFAVIRDQVRLGELLKKGLVARGWKLLNDTPLPVACFEPTQSSAQVPQERLAAIVRELVAEGESWISLAKLSMPDSSLVPTLRACIATFRTQDQDIQILLEGLERTLNKVDNQTN